MNSKNIKDAIDLLLQGLKDNGYSRNTIAFYRGRCNAILAHAEQETVEFNLEYFMLWADKHTEDRSNSIQCCMRKVLVMLDCIIRDLPFPQGNLFTVVPLKVSSPEFAEMVGTFTKTLIGRSLAEKTVRFSIYCATHFFSYMEKKNINSVADITGKHVIDYLLFNGQNLETSTKRAMAYRLKQLLKCLYEEGLSGENLSLSVFTDYAVRKKLVTVLPDDAQKALTEWKGVFSSTRQARDYAICMLALRLMLRKSDILKLKLTDIDWVAKKISIIQKKTRIPLTLPLTDDVGNALAVYILDFRPELGYDEVFLRVAFPIRPMSNITDCLHPVLRQVGYKKELAGYGLHLLRRTGASNLLRMGTPVDMISTMLGHQNVSTVDLYLSTDEKRMLLCCGDFKVPGFLMEVPK